MCEEDKIERLRKKCFDSSFHSFGKAFIHEERSKKYNRQINLLTTLGIIVPVTIGATVLGYGIDNSILKYMISIAIPMSIFQLVFSLISVVYKWSDELSYSNESAQEHYFLSERFKKLGEFPPDSFVQLNFEFELINTRL
jgi:mobilome CxxCx(11)CxxC protein